MAIGDLLAQISGDKPPAPKPVRPKAMAVRPAPILKRRADDVGNGANKAPRLSAPRSSTSPTASSTPLSTLASTQKPLDRRPPTQTPLRPPNVSDATKSAMATRLPMNRVQSGRITKATAPNKPTLSVGARAAVAVAARSSVESPKAPPKKRSYAEIMARGTLVQQTMGPLGGIRHKPIEVTAKKDKSPETTRPTSSSNKPGLPSTNGQLKRSNTMPPTTARNGTAGTNTATRNGGAGTNTVRPGRGSGDVQSKDVKRNGTKAPPPEPEKKIKKAALATTGYTGTARPMPTTSVAKGKPTDAPTRAGLVNPHASRASKASSTSRYRDRDEEEDEDLDDFIEYDDDDDDLPKQKRYDDYDSDASSDMEAGLEDIDGEEQYAARMARKEDEAEEAALRQAKLLKERKKLEFAKIRAQRGARGV